MIKVLFALVLLVIFVVTPAFSQEQLLATALAEKASKGKLPAQAKQVMEQALEDLRKSEIARTAARVGSKIPDFTLPNALGVQVSSKTVLRKGPMILTFYRGGWCPYCNLQLLFYQKALPEFVSKGATLVAVSPETPTNALSTKEKNALGFEVLSDKNNKLATSLGLVYSLPQELKAVYGTFGIDLEKSQANPDWKLPLSATYVVGKDGVIKWAFVDVDYKKRAEPVDILKALDNL